MELTEKPNAEAIKIRDGRLITCVLYSSDRDGQHWQVEMGLTKGANSMVRRKGEFEERRSKGTWTGNVFERNPIVRQKVRLGKPRQWSASTAAVYRSDRCPRKS